MCWRESNQHFNSCKWVAWLNKWWTISTTQTLWNWWGMFGGWASSLLFKVAWTCCLSSRNIPNCTGFTSELDNFSDHCWNESQWNTFLFAQKISNVLLQLQTEIWGPSSITQHWCNTRMFSYSTHRISCFASCFPYTHALSGCLLEDFWIKDISYT